MKANNTGYVIFTIGPGVFAVIGIVVAYVKRDNVQGSINNGVITGAAGTQ